MSRLRSSARLRCASAAEQVRLLLEFFSSVRHPRPDCAEFSWLRVDHRHQLPFFFADVMSYVLRKDLELRVKYFRIEAAEHQFIDQQVSHMMFLKRFGDNAHVFNHSLHRGIE